MCELFLKIYSRYQWFSLDLLTQKVYNKTRLILDWQGTKAKDTVYPSKATVTQHLFSPEPIHTIGVKCLCAHFIDNSTL